MADNPTSPFLALPKGIDTTVAVDTTRDADRLTASLLELGFRATPLIRQPMATDLIPYLDAALRLHNWTILGISIHRAAGFLEALDVDRDVFGFVDDEGTGPTPLGIAVLCFVCERFAWNGISELGANVVRDDLTDDAALEALAEYLWKSRHGAPAASLPQR
jgi:hypothetical protein